MISFLLLNTLLFIGTYIAGCIPISFNFQQSKLRLLTLFGAGLLLGAALVIIIPEGVESIYDSVHKSDSHHSNARLAAEGKDTLIRKAREANIMRPGDAVVVPQANANPVPEASHTVGDHELPLPFPFTNTPQCIGFALLTGYLFMLLLDHIIEPVLQLPVCACTVARLLACCRRCRATTATATQPPLNSVTASHPSSLGLPSSSHATGQRRITATVGFVFHSFADGLALGAAFAVEQIRLEIVLFLAIILHKVPAAFGLSCYLIHEGFCRRDIRLQLLIFSAASPVAALATYTYLVWPSAGMTASESSAKVGFALLLSGGTFLYVAASHVLPELIHSTTDTHQHLNTIDSSAPVTSNVSSSTSDYAVYTMSSQEPIVTYTNSGESTSPDRSGRPPSHAPSRLKCTDLCVLLLGSVVPLFLTLGHSH